MKKKIGFAQFNPRFGDQEFNRTEIERLTSEGAHADLLVFPELSVTGYEFRDIEELRALAEPFKDGETFSLVRGLAEKHRVTIVVGYPEADGEQIFNSCMLMQPNGDAANYRKVQLFSRETKLFTPGDAEPPVVETPAGRVGLMICFDWVFPEIARILALKGAQIFAHPSNLVLPYCQQAMFARSVENRVFSITSNRIGTEMRVDRHLNFTGLSQVLAPDGKMKIQAPRGIEQVGVVEVDVEEADKKWITFENHVIEDRRVDLYSKLL